MCVVVLGVVKTVRIIAIIRALLIVVKMENSGAPLLFFGEGCIRELK